MIEFLGVGELAQPAGLTWQVLTLIAGAHLLHLLGMLALALPWRCWLQPRVLAGPVLRFLVIQVPVQLLAVIELPLLAPGAHGHRPLTVPAVTVVGAGALAALTLLFLRRPASESTEQ